MTELQAEQFTSPTGTNTDYSLWERYILYSQKWNQMSSLRGKAQNDVLPL